MKRGQVTIFIILGIIILAAVILFMFVKSIYYFGPATQERLQQEFPSIKTHIENCLKDFSEPYIRKIGMQGGILNPAKDTYKYYFGDKIPYLCYNILNDRRCSNRMLLKSQIERDLMYAIKPKLTECIDIDSFKKSGYEIEYGAMNFNIVIGQDSVLALLNFPITIKKDQAQAKEDRFKAEIKYPLGRLFNAAQDIITAESLIGNFDSTVYSFMKTKNTNIPYIIKKLQPYPDKLYILKIKDIPTANNPYIFQFLIQGEEK